MFARFVCVFACFVLAHCLPTRLLSPEELGVKVTAPNSNLSEYDYEEILKELAEEDAKITTENVLDIEENPATKEETPGIVAVTEDTKDKTDLADNGDKFESPRVKRDVKDRTDIETIITVKNNKIGTEKNYYFRTIKREVKGETYRCKIGLTSGDVIFYYRCLLNSNGVTGEGLQETGQGDFFDIA